MNKSVFTIRNLAIGVSLWTTAGLTSAITLSAFNTTFNNPIGIDWYEPALKLIMSVNYEDGLPNNLDLVDPTNGTHTPYSTLSDLTNEVKVATVRSGACQGGFSVGDAFIGNGIAGQVAKVASGGAPVTFTFATLPGETALIRGSLFQDRFCAANGDLIVVTGNEQEAGNPGGINTVGDVWRVTSSGVPTKVATIGDHLEGVTTLPNDPLVYGPLAGRILAGAEDYDNTAGPPTYDANGGKIYAVDPNGTDVWFTISGAVPVGSAGACTLDSGGHATPNHCNFQTANAFHPEDLDVIRHNADLFGVDFGDGLLLTASASDPDLANRCGQVLITQEFPTASTSGLYGMHWNGSAFVVDPLPLTALLAVGGTSASVTSVKQWEHVTFTSGADCFGLKVVKSPKQGDPASVFTSGSKVSFSIVVTATGASDDTNVVLTDQLPGNGGLVWSTASASNGAACSIVNNLLTCQLGTVAVGSPVTVTVNSTATTPAAACQNQPNPDAHATADHGLTADDSGFLTCTPPPQLKVVKSPKNGTFTQGGQTSFTIVVSNPAAAGSSSATNVMLTDQLPGSGGLVWTTVSINPAQGGCTLTSNSLNCTLGTIAAGGSVTVKVTSATTTPAAACQSQSNPDAHATADGGLVADDSGSLTCTPPVNLVTVTQGGWGAPAHGNNPGTVLNAYFTAHPGYAPMIGDITNACTGKTLTFTSANAIRGFLPAGGTPGKLTVTATNPTSSSAGVFAGQVLALTLNTQALSSGSSLLSFVLTSGPAAGKTVGTVLADADKALGGCALPSYVTSISQLNDIVDTINNMFD